MSLFTIKNFQLLLLILCLSEGGSWNLFAQSTSDSLQVSGIWIQAFGQNRQDEVFLDLSPGHDTVAVPKLDNPGITIALGTNMQRYSIAGLSAVGSEGLVPLNLRRAGSSFSIKLRKQGPEMTRYGIYLKDDGMGVVWQLEADSLELDFEAMGMEGDRFSLIVQQILTSIPIPQPFNHNYGCPSFPGLHNHLRRNIPEPFSIWNLGGMVILESDVSGFNFPNLPEGYYLFRFHLSGKSCIIKTK